MEKGTIKMILCVGNAGTGKTTAICKKLDELDATDVFLTTQNRTASSRLKGVLKNMKNITVSEQLRKKIHVGFSSYEQTHASNIVIDEFGVLSKIDFEGFLHNANNEKMKGKDITIYCYGDSHQLPCINKLGALDAVWIENFNLFSDKEESFNTWMQQLYGNVSEKRSLKVANGWSEIDTLEVKVLERNFRMEKNNWNAIDYDEDFFQELKEEHSYHDNYDKYLSKCIDENWLILSPSYDRLKEANQLLINTGYNPQLDFPFIYESEHKRSEVYLNPYNTRLKEFKKFFPDIPYLQKEQVNPNEMLYICGCVVNNVQGMETDRVCYYMGIVPIPPKSNDFYTNNNLYTAMTRGKKDWLYLGCLSDFDKIMQTPRRDARQQTVSDYNYEALEQAINIMNNSFGKIRPYDCFKDCLNNLTCHTELTIGKWSKTAFARQLKGNLQEAHNEKTAKYLDWATDVIEKSKKQGNSLGGKNRAGKGKTQRYLEDLCKNQPKEFETLKHDAFILTRQAFAEKHPLHKARNNVRDIITQIESE
jgi:hypothetical protein